MKINKKEVSGYNPCFRIHLALCFLCLIFINLKAGTEFQFKQLGTLDGLSGNNITCVYQDQMGFIWIGTTYGLNRYDGSNVYTYQNNPFDSTSILSNRVNCILEDNETNLWIGTEEGLTRYNHFTNSFSHYQFEASYASTETLNFILSIYQDSRDELWITSRFGLIKFNHNSGEYSIYFPNTTIKQVLEDKQNNFWIASWENGLVEFNRDKETWIQYLPPKGLSERTNNHKTFSLFEDSNGFLWIGNEWEELWRFDPIKRRYLDVLKNPDPDKHITLKAQAFLEDDNERIWLCTPSGIVIISKSGEYLGILTNNRYSQNSLSCNICINIFEDKDGRFWISTLTGGVNIYDPNRLKFKDNLPAINQSPNRLNKSFKSAYVDKDNYLWIGTDYGLNKLNRQGDIIQTDTYSAENPNSIGVGGVTGITNDLEGDLWVGTWGGGLYQFYEKKNKFIKFPYSEGLYHDPHHISTNLILGFTLDDEGYIWIKNVAERVNRLDPRNNTISHYVFDFKARFHHSLIVDTVRQSVWISSYNGFYQIDKKTGEITGYQNNPQNHNSLNNNTVHGLCLGNDGKLWLTTAGGLNRFDPEKNSFKLFTNTHGSNNLLAIQCDPKGILWIGNDRGLTRFDPDTRRFRNYTTYEGAIPNALYSYQAPDGTLFFGGSEGVNVFHPDEISQGEQIPKVVITGFATLGEFNHDIKHFLRFNSLTSPREMVLSHNQINFAIRFASLNYTMPEKNQFAYKLEGYDKDWIYVNTRNEAFYTNLNPGSYTFKVKASNHDGLWNEEGVSMKITITPPYWKTWQFKTLLISISFVIVLLGLRIQKRYSLVKKGKLLAKVKERSSQLFDINLLLLKQMQNLQNRNQKILEVFDMMGPEDDAKNSPDEEFLKKLMEVIEQNISNEELSVNFLIKELGVGRTVLYYKIKSLTGYSINDFIQTLRLKKAAHLLKTKQYTISEVSYLVGFKNPKYFSSCFRAQFGTTPSNYAANTKVI